MRLLTLFDIRFAFRSLGRRPGLTAAVVATLALGIGGSTTIFSLLDAALLQPVPFADPDRLVFLSGVAGPERIPRGASVPEVRDWARMSTSLAGIAQVDNISLSLRGEEYPERIQGEMVSAHYFELIGARAARGRTFLAEEDSVPDAHPVVVVSHGFWQQRFGGDPGLVGRAITLNDRPLTVVGIMPEGFSGMSFQAEVWVPMALMSLIRPVSVLEDRGSRWLTPVARLRDGVPLGAAQADLDAVAARLAASYPETNADRGVQLMDLDAAYLGDTESLLVLLFAAVGVFLLIACVNVMNLQLVGATARQQEMAVRLALGAGRGQLVRQLLTEGLVLGGLGGAVGVVLAAWAVAVLFPMLPPGFLPSYVEAGLDGRVLAWSLAVTLVTGLLCGLAPILMALRHDLSGAMGEGGRTSAAGLGRIRRPGMQQVLVVAEVALALILLVGAGLMVRSLQAQLEVSPGFEAEGVVGARMTLPSTKYSPEQRRVFADRLLERLNATPGLRGAALASELPLRGGTTGMFIRVRPEAEPIRVFRHQVSPGYFATLGTPMLRGRGITIQDREDAPPVAVVSEATAARLWPGEEAIGQRFLVGEDAVEVVGVATTTRFRDLTTDLGDPNGEADVYFSLAQLPPTSLEIAVRAQGDTLAAAAALRAAVASVDPTVPLYNVAPLLHALRGQSADARVASLVFTLFSAMALALASVGIYGVLAFIVSLSRREIAIRMALGAESGRVLALVVRNAMLLVGAGVVAGVLGALFGTRLLTSQLFRVTPTDPATFAGVTAAVLVTALLASWLPARRAAATPPQSALKGE